MNKNMITREEFSQTLDERFDAFEKRFEAKIDAKLDAKLDEFAAMIARALSDIHKSLGTKVSEEELYNRIRYVDGRIDTVQSHVDTLTTRTKNLELRVQESS